MKRVIKIVLLCLLAFALFACGSGNNSTSGSSGASGASGAKTESNKNIKKPVVEMSIKEYGVIKLELEPEFAPITVENFVKLVNDGFYNGLTFTRVVPGYMILGGDPTKDGTGTTGTSIKGEFEQNGVNNPLKHTRGAISMARLENQFDSASSQFFIMQQDSEDLDGSCAVFGYIIEDGIKVVDKICEEVPTDEYGQVDFMEQPIIEYIKVIK